MSTAQAQDDGSDTAVVVELFTSQGCSSCPPADQLLAEMGKLDYILPLALHVDYWDYIGWKDRFAQPEFTARQKAYARAQGRRMIYTPQMIVMGTDAAVGTRPMDLAALVAKARTAPRPVTLSLARHDGRLHVRAEAKRRIGPCDVFLVRYDAEREIAIERGENAGLTATYTHIVTEWIRVARWSGQEPLSLDLPAGAQGHPVVVLVQAEAHGPILAAARLR